MAREPIPEDIRRFILTSIASVPYLEALLLLRAEPEQPWESQRLARRIYVSEKVAGELLAELKEAGIAAPCDAPETYCYHPGRDEIRSVIDQLAEVYAKNLIEVTNLIHSKVDKKAQRFADAFRFRQDP